jgi:phosphatidylinositol glycan class W
MNENNTKSTDKQLHEMFISGNNGTSLWEISTVASAAPLCIFLRFVLLFCLPSFNFLSSTWKMFAVDFFFLVLLQHLWLTSLSPYTGILLVTVISVVFMCVALWGWYRPASVDFYKQPLYNKRHTYISYFRAYANVATAICILAVDFPSFPRRFCKTETFGTGLMDMGVGAFVMANGLVSVEARSTASNLKLSTAIKQIFSTWPLVVLGIARVIAVKSVDYHEHVTEYGVHWNFFFTLAVIKILSSLLLVILPIQYCWLYATVLTIGYELVLNIGGLQQYILYGPGGRDSRIGLLNANREGIFSCLGYLSVFLFSVQLGRWLMQPKLTIREFVRTLYQLIVINVVCWMLLWTTVTLTEPVSRRMANLSFVVWMLAYNVLCLITFLGADVACMFVTSSNSMSKNIPREAKKSTSATAMSLKQCEKYQPQMLEAINRNGLLFFMLSNLLTGAVNMAIVTRVASDLVSFCVVFVYLVVLCLIASVLHRFNLTVKFW